MSPRTTATVKMDRRITPSLCRNLTFCEVEAFYTLGWWGAKETKKMSRRQLRMRRSKPLRISLVKSRQLDAQKLAEGISPLTRGLPAGPSCPFNPFVTTASTSRCDDSHSLPSPTPANIPLDAMQAQSRNPWLRTHGPRIRGRHAGLQSLGNRRRLRHLRPGPRFGPPESTQR